MANFTVNFTPFEVNNNAQLITTATVINPNTNETYWSEDVIIDVTAGMTNDDIKQALQAKTSGFAERVEAIELAKQYAGQTPTL